MDNDTPLSPELKKLIEEDLFRAIKECASKFPSSLQASLSDATIRSLCESDPMQNDFMQIMDDLARRFSATNLDTTEYREAATQTVKTYAKSKLDIDCERIREEFADMLSGKKPARPLSDYEFQCLDRGYWKEVKRTQKSKKTNDISTPGFTKVERPSKTLSRVSAKPGYSKGFHKFMENEERKTLKKESLAPAVEFAQSSSFMENDKNELDRILKRCETENGVIIMTRDAKSLADILKRVPPKAKKNLQKSELDSSSTKETNSRDSENQRQYPFSPPNLSISDELVEQSSHSPSLSHELTKGVAAAKKERLTAIKEASGYESSTFDEDEDESTRQEHLRKGEKLNFHDSESKKELTSGKEMDESKTILSKNEESDDSESINISISSDEH